jgi:hypothetical protein
MNHESNTTLGTQALGRQSHRHPYETAEWQPKDPNNFNRQNIQHSAASGVLSPLERLQQDCGRVHQVPGGRAYVTLGMQRKQIPVVPHVGELEE